MIADYPLIPDQAFLYMPSNERIVEYQNETRTRIIFGGGVPFDEEQKHHISQLKAYIKNQSRKQYLSSYSDDFLLRFLQATSFNYDECLQSLENYHNWQKKMLPLTLADNILKYLKQGPLYMSGRDYHFRPIVVVNIKKILELKIKEQQLLNMLGFFFQYLIQHCLIEGQVQTWNTIIDLGNCSVFSLGGTLVGIIKHLSEIFKARSNHNYLLNFPSSIKLILGMIKSVLKQSQLRKITMCEGKFLKQQDFAKINRHQVQLKYGGRHPDMKNFWPVQIDPYVYTAPSSKIDRPITQTEYDKLYTQGKLKDRKIKKSLIKKFSNKITEVKMQEQDVLTQRNGSKIQKSSKTMKNSEIKSEEMVFPEQKRPFNPGPLEKVFTFEELF